MTTLTLGRTVPNFELPATGDKTVTLEDFKGKRLLLYFYPKDNTPGCTQEGQAFRDNHQAFTEMNVAILGVSRDSVKMHEGFKSKQAFPFDLISDADETLCQMFDVIKMKNMYGKQVRGIERSTFLIDENGVLVHEWRKVKVKDHVAELLAYLRGAE
jgi:peroxiredoxin Q/BCP